METEHYDKVPNDFCTAHVCLQVVLLLLLKKAASENIEVKRVTMDSACLECKHLRPVWKRDIRESMASQPFSLNPPPITFFDNVLKRLRVINVV